MTATLRWARIGSNQGLNQDWTQWTICLKLLKELDHLLSQSKASDKSRPTQIWNNLIDFTLTIFPLSSLNIHFHPLNPTHDRCHSLQLPVDILYRQQNTLNSFVILLQRLHSIPIWLHLIVFYKSTTGWISGKSQPAVTLQSLSLLSARVISM